MENMFDNERKGDARKGKILGKAEQNGMKVLRGRGRRKTHSVGTKSRSVGGTERQSRECGGCASKILTL